MIKCEAFTGRVSLNGPRVLSSFIMVSNDLLTFISCLGSMRRGRRGTVPFLTCELQRHYFEPENNTSRTSTSQIQSSFTTTTCQEKSLLL